MLAESVSCGGVCLKHLVAVRAPQNSSAVLYSSSVVTSIKLEMQCRLHALTLLHVGPWLLKVEVHLVGGCLRVSLVAINTVTKSNLRRKGFQLTGDNPLWSEVRSGAQVRNLVAGTKTENMEEFCLLTLPHIHVQLRLLQPRPVYPEVVPFHFN